MARPPYQMSTQDALEEFHRKLNEEDKVFIKNHNITEEFHYYFSTQLAKDHNDYLSGQLEMKHRFNIDDFIESFRFQREKLESINQFILTEERKQYLMESWHPKLESLNDWIEYIHCMNSSIGRKITLEELIQLKSIGKSANDKPLQLFKTKKIAGKFVKVWTNNIKKTISGNSNVDSGMPLKVLKEISESNKVDFFVTGKYSNLEEHISYYKTYELGEFDTKISESQQKKAILALSFFDENGAFTLYNLQKERLASEEDPESEEGLASEEDPESEEGLASEENPESEEGLASEENPESEEGLASYYEDIEDLNKIDDIKDAVLSFYFSMQDEDSITDETRFNIFKEAFFPEIIKGNYKEEFTEPLTLDDFITYICDFTGIESAYLSKIKEYIKDELYSKLPEDLKTLENSRERFSGDQDEDTNEITNQSYFVDPNSDSSYKPEILRLIRGFEDEVAEPSLSPIPHSAIKNSGTGHLGPILE